MAKLKRSTVLRYAKGRSRSQNTIKRHYKEWRDEQSPPIPFRCDNPKCMFFSSPLIWNGVAIKLILDHINGVNGDNRTGNLRFLCPNCNSQLGTQGGANKGRIIQDEGGYAIIDENKNKHYVLPAEVGEFSLISDSISMETKKSEK